MSRKSKRRRAKPKSQSTSSVVEEQVSTDLEFVDDRPVTALTRDSEPVAGPDEEPVPESATVMASPEPTEPTERTDPTEPTVHETPPPPVGTLGELLITAREARGVSLEEASSRTRISGPMLRNLENDRFSEFPAETYVRGFLRNYGAFLGLDVGMLLRRYEALAGRRVEPAPDVWEEDVGSPAVWARRRLVVRWTVLVALAAGLGLGAREIVGWALARSSAPQSAGLEAIERELDNIGPATPVQDPVVRGPGATSQPEKTEPQPQELVKTTQPVRAESDRTPASNSSRRGAGSVVTDLTEELGPELVLQARANGPCLVRLQVDTDPGHTVLHQFTQAGQTRTWSARSGFQVRVENPSNLELRLNGNLVVPTEGRMVVLDHAALETLARARGTRSTTSP